MKAMLVDVKTWCVGDRFKKDGGGKRADRYKGNADGGQGARPRQPDHRMRASSSVRTRKTGRKALYMGGHVQTFDGV